MKKRMTCLVFITFLGFLLVGSSNVAFADHCKGQHKNDPGCEGSGGNGGPPDNDLIFQVDLADDTDFISVAPVYNPSCDAFTPGGNEYSAHFDRHDLCATVTTSTGATLTDDIRILATTNRNGELISLQLIGQDTIGREGIFHESEIIELSPPVVPSPDGFTIVINQDSVPIYKCDKHLRCNNRLEMIGEIALDLMIYSPVQ